MPVITARKISMWRWGIGSAGADGGTEGRGRGREGTLADMRGSIAVHIENEFATENKAFD